MDRNAKPYCVQLCLVDRRCLVVGAGTVATRKIRDLLDTGAKITVVAPKWSTQIEQWVSERRIEAYLRPFEPADVHDCDLVFAATADRSINDFVVATAHPHQWVNAVDARRQSSFYGMAVVERGFLQIAVGTSGQFPALAVHIRRQVEAWFPEEYDRYVTFLAQARASATHLPLDVRKQLYTAWLDPQVEHDVRIDYDRAWQIHVVLPITEAMNLP